MKKALVLLGAVVGFSALAQAEPSTIVRCEKYEGNTVVIVEVQRDIANIYTPKVHFVDTLKSEVRVIDPGSAAPYVNGKITKTDVTNLDLTYVGKNFLLKVSYNYTSEEPTDNTGGFVYTGPAVFSVKNSKGQVEDLDMTCKTYDHF